MSPQTRALLPLHHDQKGRELGHPGSVCSTAQPRTQHRAAGGKYLQRRLGAVLLEDEKRPKFGEFVGLQKEANMTEGTMFGPS